MIAALDEEREVIGACLISPSAIDQAVDAGLQPAHFSLPSLATYWQAIQKLCADGTAVDALTLAAATNTKPEQLLALSAEVVPSHTKARVERVIKIAALRAKERGAMMILEAARNGADPKAIEEGTKLILEDPQQTAQPTEPEQLTQWIRDYLHEPAPVETFELPWATLNKYSPGGLQRGHMVLLAAFTSIGKSIVIGQMLEAFAKQGYKGRLYTTEMTREEVLCRHVTRMSGVKFSRLLLRNLEPDEMARAEKSLDRHPPPFSLIDASGWTVDRIRLDARRHGADCVVIDPINLLPYRGVEEANEAARAIQALGHDLNCVTIAVTHLNRARQDGDTYPRPALRDIRDTGMFESNADRVLAFYRENQAAKEGELYWLKVRGGILGHPVPVDFDGPNFSVWEKPTAENHPDEKKDGIPF